MNLFLYANIKSQGHIYILPVSVYTMVRSSWQGWGLFIKVQYQKVSFKEWVALIAKAVMFSLAM